MSETQEDPWVPQGFFSPMATATAAKTSLDYDPRIGAMRPDPGQPPAPVDKEGTVGMFAVHSRPGNPIPCPPGMREADPALVGRLLGW